MYSLQQQGAHGHMDGMGQRRPIHVVVKTYLHKFLTYSKELMRLFKHSVALTFRSCGFASQVLSIHLKG